MTNSKQTKKSAKTVTRKSVTTAKPQSSGLSAKAEKVISSIRIKAKNRPNRENDVGFSLNAEILRTYLNSDNPHNTPPCFWGGSGIGKTELIRQVAVECGYQVFEYSMATADTLSFEGVPYISDDNETLQAVPLIAAEMRRAVSAGKKVLLFLDEVNQAVPLVQHALFQLFLPNNAGERRLGQHMLPVGVRLVAAANPPVVNDHLDAMAAPLENRMSHHDFQVDFDLWDIYEQRRSTRNLREAEDALLEVLKSSTDTDEHKQAAIGVSVARELVSEVLPAIVAFLRDNTQMFYNPHYYDDQEQNYNEVDEYAATRRNPNPRSWSQLADQLAEAEARQMAEEGKRLDKPVLVALARGMLGAGIGGTFAAYYANIASLPPPSEIIASPKVPKIGDAPEHRYFQVERLATYITQESHNPDVVTAGIEIAISMMIGENNYEVDIPNGARLARRLENVLLDSFNPEDPQPKLSSEVYDLLDKAKEARLMSQS